MSERPVQRAFTLLELVMVIVLLGILIAFAWPDFSATTKAAHLEEAGRRMATLVAMCRAEAMNECRNYRIEIRPDGSVRTRRQYDPLDAPDQYVLVQTDWGPTEVLLEDVWVAAVQVMPEGPAPIWIVDDELQTPETEYDLMPVEKLEQPLTIDFAPNGACNSVRWLLRDALGRGLLLTLDGRLGRVAAEEWETAQPGDAVRPEALPEEPEKEPVLEKRK